MSAPSTTTTTPPQPSPHPTTHPLILQVDFAWSKFRNIISEKTPDDHLTPIYIQHFRPTKPQLRIETAVNNTKIATGTMNTVSISGSCTLHGREILLKPLKRFKTHYNYLSHALANPEPVPVSWIANCGLKVWDFVCLNAETQEPIAKFGINMWGLKTVGSFEFERGQGATEAVRDEVVVTGLTLVYIMMMRMNNPLSLIGAAFASTGKVEGDEGGESVELREGGGERVKPREEDGGKTKMS